MGDKPTSKRYPQHKPSESEMALEQTLDGLACPTKCNGYGQGLSTRARVAQPAVRGTAAAEPSATGTFRMKQIVENGCNPGGSVEHAAYTDPKAPREDGTYRGTQTGYTSGYARNNPNRADDPNAAAQPVTIEDVHPSVARGIRTRDPVEHASLVNPDAFTTTYKQTIDATARAVTRPGH